jgi:class 3 adenylate cyclase
MIPDEPVRGRTPPPWIHALPGIERMRATSRGMLPTPPLARLLGLRTTNVAAGSATVVMPAAEAFMTGGGQIDLSALMMSALRSASYTALPPGVDAVPRVFTSYMLRPAWPGPGNMLARARVVHSGNLFVHTEVQVEDPDGRHCAHGILQSTIRQVEPAPPPPPETMQPVEEPVYETPDPYLRRFEAMPLRDLFERGDGQAMARVLCEGRIPIGNLLGLDFEEVTPGRSVVSMPASEWFCVAESDVSPNALAAFATLAGWASMVPLLSPGRSLASGDGTVHFLRPARSDGRRLRAESRVTDEPPPVASSTSQLSIVNTTIHDADGQLVALRRGSMGLLDNTLRTHRARKTSRRLLATLLFVDIVDSTAHAERLGDAGWQRLLEEHRLAVRREISRYNGTEVDTTGDGFFVRFDSPVRAIDAACAARHATASLGIEVRTGIHTGECELQGNRLAGMAVHIAARIQAAAQAGEILVSSTVRDLSVGSTVRLADRGEQRLKGVPDPWRLYAVVD